MMTDFETWMQDCGFNRIFRLYSHKSSPLEMQHFLHVVIKEVIELPDKDVFIGFQEITSWEELYDEEPVITYDKLSNIKLKYFPIDNVEENWMVE